MSHQGYIAPVQFYPQHGRPLGNFAYGFPYPDNSGRMIPASPIPNSYQGYYSVHDREPRPAFPYDKTPKVLPNNFKTKRCRHFDMGKCKMGNECNFAHGDVDISNSSNIESLRNFQPQHITSIDVPMNNCSSKILSIEANLDGFIDRQKTNIQQLKNLVANLKGQNNQGSDLNVSLKGILS